LFITKKYGWILTKFEKSVDFVPEKCYGLIFVKLWGSIIDHKKELYKFGRLWLGLAHVHLAGSETVIDVLNTL